MQTHLSDINTSDKSIIYIYVTFAWYVHFIKDIPLITDRAHAGIKVKYSNQLHL